MTAKVQQTGEQITIVDFDKTYFGFNIYLDFVTASAVSVPSCPFDLEIHDMLFTVYQISPRRLQVKGPVPVKVYERLVSLWGK